MAKLIDICGICGGKGKFITQKCPSCNGTGGVVLKPDKQTIASIEQNRSSLSEQETQIWDLYKSGFTQKEIAQKMSLTISLVASALYRIQKKTG